MKKTKRSVKGTGGDPTPIYFKLQKQIQRDIENGHWALGQALPSEKKIAEDVGVSLGTVQKAILNLVNEGYLYRLQGKGTFVPRSTIRRENIRYYRFLSGFSGREVIFKIKLVDLNIVEGIKKVNHLLKLSASQQLYELKRVFSYRGKAYLYTISYLPISLFKDLDKLPRSQLEKIFLYESLEQNYGLPTVSNQELIGATFAKGEIAEILETDEGHAILMMEMLAFSYKKKPYEYRLAYGLTDERKLFKAY